jgi:hypothetical protein
LSVLATSSILCAEMTGAFQTHDIKSPANPMGDTAAESDLFPRRRKKTPVANL